MENKLLGLRFRLERTERRWMVVILGILRFAQNDGKGLSRQEQWQKQKQQQRTGIYGWSDSSFGRNDLSLVLDSFLGRENSLRGLRFRLERTERRWMVVILGILRFAQNDGKGLSHDRRGLSRQEQCRNKKQKQKQGQQQRIRVYGWSDSVHPTLRKCAKDGAPGGGWLFGGGRGGGG